MSDPLRVTARCPHCHSLLTSETGGVCLRCLGERALRTGPQPAADGFTPGLVHSATTDQAVGTAPGVASLPRQFGAYEILEELGRGGMGSVYLARQIELNRLVALKLIAGGQGATAEAEARFQRETQTIALLHHPNIVAIHAAGRCDGQLFYAMDYVDGIDLGRACAIDPLEPREAAQLLAAVARGIQHAHERGIIHRDLKPSNIMLDAEGVPRVADFGIAQWTFEPAGLTRTGQILGSPAFMPPEQAAGEYSPAADIYALGAVLHFALTGRPPFAAANALEVFAQIAHDPAPPPSALQAGVPAALDAICLRCLEKKPGDRYPTAAALAEELGRWLAGEKLLTTYAPLAEARRLVEDVRAQIRHQSYQSTLWPSYVERLARASQLAPELAEPQHELARLHIQLLTTGADASPARRELARLSIERAEALDPTSPDTRAARVSYMIAAEGRVDDAWPLLAKLAVERPDDARIQAQFGRACLRTGRWMDAKRTFRHLLELEPTLAIPRTLLAYTLLHLREYDDAALWQDEALRLQGGLVSGSLLGIWYGWQADPSPSRTLARLRALPEDSRCNTNVAWCECQVLLTTGRRGEALARYRESVCDPQAKLIFQLESVAYRLHLERLAHDPAATASEAELQALLAPGRQQTITTPQDALQYAYARALLGQRKAALALADRGVDMCPISKHAIDGARYAGANEFEFVPGRLVILAVLDERDRFFLELEHLLNVPAAVDPRYLAMDPTFDALRADPRFERIMATVQIPIPTDGAASKSAPV